MGLFIENNTGAKYYKKLDDGKIDIFRLIRVKKSTAIVLRDGKRVSITKEEFDTYTKLKPIGYIGFAIIELDNKLEDVMITLHKRSDIDKNDDIPFAVCRQNIYDVFTNSLKSDDDGYVYVGCSVNKNTIPPEIPFKIMLACNKIIHMRVVCVYLNDTLNDILHIVDLEKFDNVLSKLSDKQKPYQINGYCKSVKNLLEVNHFMNDFYKAFDIYKIKFKLEYNDFILNQDQVDYFQNILKVELLRTYVVKYEMDVNINNLKRDHIIVSDYNNDLFIVGFDKGNTINIVDDDIKTAMVQN